MVAPEDKSTGEVALLYNVTVPLAGVPTFFLPVAFVLALPERSTEMSFEAMVLLEKLLSLLVENVMLPFSSTILGFSVTLTVAFTENIYQPMPRHTMTRTTGNIYSQRGMD